jgi:hypothetical protein
MRLLCSGAPDTIDLQDPRSPSAQDHSHHPKNAGIGKHQDQSIRRAEQDSLDEIARGPASPGEHKDSFGSDPRYASYGDRDGHSDSAAVSAATANEAIDHYVGNGQHTDDDGLVDSDEEDQLDDDLMDKISSSPSIDDGKLPLGSSGCVEARKLIF